MISGYFCGSESKNRNMKIKVFKIAFVSILILLVNVAMMAQDKNGDKEVIIIEKTIDQDGNVISKSIKRNQGNYTEEELDKLMEEDQDHMLRSFDMEGMGFGDLNGLFGTRSPENNKAKLGVLITTENGQAIIKDVITGSGAADDDPVVPRQRRVAGQRPQRHVSRVLPGPIRLIWTAEMALPRRQDPVRQPHREPFSKKIRHERRVERARRQGPEHKELL